MSTRKLLLILVPAAALLIFALLRSVRDDDSVSGPVASLVHGDGPLAAAGSAAVLPGGADGAAPRVVPLPVDDALGAAGAPELPAIVNGSIAVRVVDAAGHPIAGEPVFLTLTHDTWAPRSNPQDHDDDQPEPLKGSGVTDGGGECAFSARAGVRHTLHAGGGHWPRVAVEDARSGDHLLVTLPEGFVLSGFVLEAETHEPIAGAHVLALADDNHVLGRTAADGGFSLGPLPAQDVIVGSYAPGFDIALQAEIAPALGPVTLELPAGKEIRGRVVDKESGAAITAGGEVRLQLDVLANLQGEADTLPGNHLVEEQKTAIAPDGAFEFVAGPSFGFTLLAAAPGYAPAVQDRYESRSVGQNDDVVISMRRLVPLTGKVLLAASDAGIAGAAVTATNDAGPFATGSSGADGSFTLDPAQWDGRNPVFVAAQDGAGDAGRVRVEDAGEPLLLQLVPPLQVTVQVLAAGTPVAGAEVAAISEGSDVSMVRTGADGVAALVHPLAGPDVGAVRLQARFADSQSLPLIIDPDQPHDDKLVLQLDGGGVMAGVVLDPQGEPVPSAQLRLAPDKNSTPVLQQTLVQLGYMAGTADPGEKSLVPPQTVHADLEGRFRIDAVVPDVAYGLRVRAEGFRETTLTPLYADPAPLTITLDPVVLWEGRLVDAASGLPEQQFIGQLLQEAVGSKGNNFHPTKQRVVRRPERPGEFSVELPEPGRFQLRLMAHDMITVLSDPVDFDGKDAPPFAALAMWPAAVLEVTIQDGRGRRVPGFSVAVIPWEAARDAQAPSGELRKQAQIQNTDDTGLARFNLGEGGAWRIGAGPGQWLDDLPVPVKPGSPQSRTYTLPPTGDLEITINDELGQPLPGVRVEVRSGRNEKVHAISRRANTHGVEGIVRIEALPPGEYDVTLHRRNYDTEKRVNVPVHGNVIERLTVAMQPRPKDTPPPGAKQGGLLGPQGTGKVR